MSPRGIAGSGPGATARSGTTATLSPPTAAATAAVNPPSTVGVNWTTAKYRFLQLAGGIIIEMEDGSFWMPVPTAASRLPSGHATNGANRATRNRGSNGARSGTSTDGAATKTSSVSRA